MHSSRMRTVHSSGRISGGGGGVGGCLLLGGCLLPGGMSATGGGVCSRGGVCSQGGSVPGGVCSWGGGGGGIPPCTEADTPSTPVDRQTPVKTQPSQLRCGR